MSALSSADVAGVQSNLTSLSSLKDSTTIISSATSGLTASVKDPIGAVLSKTLSSINSLSATVSSKITKLEEDIVTSADNTGKVKLVNNVIVVTLEPADAAKLPQYQAKIQGDINLINNNINKLSTVISTLSIVSQTAQTLQKAMQVQEIALSLSSPVSAATMLLLKKALQILFYKDVLGEYVNIIASQVATSTQALNDLIAKFSGLSVQFVINSDQNNGITTSPDQAQASLSASSLVANQGNIPQDYIANNGKTYVLSIEAYGTKELIGRARDKFSGLLVVETSPSFISTPAQLQEELKTILNQ